MWPLESITNFQNRKQMIYSIDICCILKVQHSIYVAHWKLEICCTLKNLIFVPNWNFNICCKLKIQYVLQIESSRCGAQWKFEMYSTLKMSPRPFPLLRINSLFHLLRIATAVEACSDRVRDKKTTITKNVNWKSRFPKIPSNSITFFSFHCTVSLLVEEACCVLT